MYVAQYLLHVARLQVAFGQNTTNIAQLAVENGQHAVEMGKMWLKMDNFY